MSDFDRQDWELRPEDRLFGQSSGDWRNNAMLVGRSSNSVAYTLGFREAAEAMIARGLKTHTQDLLLFPILFSYRHAVELALKELIYLGQRNRGDPVEVQRSHRLRVLWPKARAELEIAGSEGEKIVLDTLGRLIDELDAVDPTSQLLRYDRDHQGFVWRLPEVLIRVDLAHLQSTMTKVLTYLSGSVDFMSEALDELDQYRPDWEY